MIDPEFEHPITFRQETARPFFEQYVKTGESCVMVFVAGGGLRRFVDFLCRADVQAHYLGAPAPLLIKVDCNRISQVSEWGLDELLLTALVESCNRYPQAAGYKTEINQLRTDVITSQNRLLAQRHLELAVDTLTQQAKLNLYFLLSEFDDLFKTLPDLELNHLRALRDAHRYQVNYALCLHQFPEQIRPGLKDMLSARIAHNLLTVGPYAPPDAERMLCQLEDRTGKTLLPALRQQILRLSGGHPGLIQAIHTSVGGLDHDLREKDLIDFLLSQAPERWTDGRSAAFYGCERIWDYLLEDERAELRKLAYQLSLPGEGEPAAEAIHRLERKRLIEIRAGQVVFFSPLFAAFIRTQGGMERIVMRIDVDTHSIYIGQRIIDDLSSRVFNLVAFLFTHRNKICRRDDIIAEVYPNEQDVSDAALASLVKQARQQIEPEDAPYRFLKTVRGVGYMLMDPPEHKEPQSVSDLTGDGASD